MLIIDGRRESFISNKDKWTIVKINAQTQKISEQYWIHFKGYNL